VAAHADLDLWDSARMLALMDLAMADGYIANWEAKYRFDRWRPETAIRLADLDGNPATEPDPTWVPLWGSSGATPEHDSGHAIEGGAAATVLRRFFGTDRIRFSICSYTMPAGGNCGEAGQVNRTFTRFSEAAVENAESRILIGWHLRTSVEQGLDRGTKIGRFTFRHFLRPVS
jgi:hypothetical protein